MATLPTRLLEVEFDAGVWTDVFADVVSVDDRRGRNRESGAFETGTLNVTLRNDGRKYDPDNTAGPYYGKLRPNRRVRFRATYNAVTYPVFVGYIDRISQVYGGPNDAVAVVAVSDLFKLLNRAELPRSVFVAAVNALVPDLWWPLDEPAGSTTVADIGAGKVAGLVQGAAALGASALVVRDPGSAMGLTGTLSAGGGFIVERVTNPAGISGTVPFSIEAWVLCAAQADDATIFYQGAVSDAATFVQLDVRGAGAYVGLLEIRIGLAAWLVSTVRVDDGAAHHVVATRDATGRLRLYIDGTDRSASVVSSAASIPIADFSWGMTPWRMYGLTGTLQHAALWRTVELSAAQAGDMNTAGRTPWRTDLPGTRLGRIFDLAGVPAGDRNIDAGTTTLQSTDLGGTALAYAQKVEETEIGWLFVTRDGKLRFIGRQAGQTGGFLTSLGTLVDDDSGAGLPYRSVGSDVDESTIVTRATASRGGSVAVTVFDATAQVEFGWLDETHDGLLHDDDGYSKHYAEWVLNTHKAPGTRVGAIELELTKDPASLYPAILALELGDRVTYKRKPQNVGAAISLDMRVEAIEHATAGGYWRTRLQLSPFNLANNLPVFVWDVTKWDEHVWGM